MRATAPPRSSEPRPWGAATRWLLFLGPFFFATYGFANWLASHRTGVGSVVFDWERAIPFLPWTVFPYWSIDLFYAASLFVCATRIELGTHARRLLAAQLLCVACFLLFPLRFSFARPLSDGAAGALFALLGSFDLPFNQAPSLHIALLVILWPLYARHARGAWRLALHAWFALIGVSVLTTWQHHFVDLPTGAWVGFLCLWLFPDRGPAPLAGAAWSADPRRRRLAAYYALGALACAGAALA
ncbi:MAG TPA: phosphatase PAP2 family protein, partial [Gammaproteobacteria bacterium]